MGNKRNALLVSFFLITLYANTQSVTLKQIGKPNMFISVMFGDQANGIFYSIDFTYALYKTDLNTGEQLRLGDATYKNTKFFFRHRNKLYSIENDASMTEIDPVSGVWSVKSSIGTWTEVERVTVVGNSFFTMQNGAFYYYSSLDPKYRRQIGGSEFFNVGILLESDSTLHSLIRDGSLYQISLATGEWKRIGKGKSKEWKFTTAAEILNNKIYTIETGGALYETSLPDGTRKLLDQNQFKNARILIASAGKLYTITSEGSLFEIMLN